MREISPWSVVFATVLMACGGSEAGGGTPTGAAVAKSGLARNQTPSDANVAALGSDNRAFAFSLYGQAAAAATDANILLSPYSVSTALAMTYAGARTSTESEMKQTLRFTLEQSALHEAFNATDLALSSRGAGKAGADGTPFRLNVDNSLWAQQGYSVLPAFLDTLALNYGAGVFLTDFRADAEGSREAINSWVDERTERLISELLPRGSITADTRFVLTNTVYFNASWKAKFEQNATYEQPFTKLDGSTVKASMMHGGFSLPYTQTSDYQAVLVPYASEELSLIAVLPAEGKFAQVEGALSGAWFDTLQSALAPAEVALGFPKLDYAAHLSLKESLDALGMKVPFTDAADFSGLTMGDVFISDVIHEAVIKVLEGGTIAAAATAVVVNDESAELYDHTVTLDRPFLFFIFDQPTGTLLFVGRVLDPTAH